MTQHGRPVEYVCEDNCPGCGHYLDAASLLEDPTARPAPGDLSVCLYCGEALEFNPILKLQLVDEHSLSGPQKAYLRRLRWAITATMKKLGPPPTTRQN